MTGITIAAVALVLGLVFGTIAVLGAPVFALPLFLLAVGGLGALEFSRRRSRHAAGREMAGRRRDAGVEHAEPVESPETLTESAPRGTDAG